MQLSTLSNKDHVAKNISPRLHRTAPLADPLPLPFFAFTLESFALSSCRGISLLVELLLNVSS